MIEETVVRSSTLGGSTGRPTRGLASLLPLGRTPSVMIILDPTGLALVARK
ncbi:MAG TPA: hypothetical protein VFH16_15530 [Rubrobacter sp.]|jgi:hypothetical protein|nr:hypothetical protein [Rubrobacter sp.]